VQNKKAPLPASAAVEQSAGTSMLSTLQTMAYNTAMSPTFTDSNGVVIVRSAEQIAERLADLKKYAGFKRDWNHPQMTVLVKTATREADAPLRVAFAAYADAVDEVCGGKLSPVEPPRDAASSAAKASIEALRNNVAISNLTDDLRDALAPTATTADEAREAILKLSLRTATKLLNNAGITATALGELSDVAGEALQRLYSKVFTRYVSSS